MSHGITCVCGECMARDQADAVHCGSSERTGALASEILRLRALIRETEDEATRVVGNTGHEAGSTVAELLDVVRGAVCRDYLGSEGPPLPKPAQTRGVSAYHSIVADMQKVDDIRAAENRARSTAGLPPWPREVL